MRMCLMSLGHCQLCDDQTNITFCCKTVSFTWLRISMSVKRQRHRTVCDRFCISQSDNCTNDESTAHCTAQNQAVKIAHCTLHCTALHLAVKTAHYALHCFALHNTMWWQFHTAHCTAFKFQCIAFYLHQQLPGSIHIKVARLVTGPEASTREEKFD